MFSRLLLSVPARRLGLELGEIRDGYLADLVVWDVEDLSMVPADDHRIGYLT